MEILQEMTYVSACFFSWKGSEKVYDSDPISFVGIRPGLAAISGEFPL
jgi:hypothetical protein